jgi:hypothetical protein
MQQLHRRLASTTLALYREWHKSIAVWLYVHIHILLLLVSTGCCGTCFSRRRRERVSDGERVRHRDVGDGDDLAESQEEVSPCTDTDAVPFPGRASPLIEARKPAQGGLKR